MQANGFGHYQWDFFIRHLAPSAWWKLNDAIGSATAADSSGNGYTGTVNGNTTEPGYDNYLKSRTPTAYWKLADAVGSATAADSSGNGYTGTVNGTVTFGETSPITGKPIETAALFDGSTGYISAAPVASGTSDFTIVAWFKTTATARAEIMDYGDTATANDGIAFYVNASGDLEADPSTVTGPVSAVAVNTGAWVMGAVVYDGANLQLYVNGVASGAAVAFTTFDITTATADIGATGTADFFPGDIAEVALWESALTAAEIAELYALAPVDGGVSFGKPGPITGTPVDTAASFDGSTGYIQAATGPAAPAGAFTFSAWMKPLATPSTPNTSGDVFTYRSGGLADGIIFAWNGDTISFGGTVYQGGNYYFFEPTERPTGEWYFVCYTYDPTAGGSLYVNGELAYSQSVTGASSLTGGSWETGNPSFLPNGDLSQLSYFPTALSAEEISALYKVATVPR